ncbi:helix-turn-helix domain-containing protein [uncultured Ruminococcus sp.]|uniref:helix-turn-helix domain-containing protein n=1 Tax=uncultured Ruminococcus sp. TaxID=165186 RepID=UPI0025E7FCB6|nr:helix-turn-helix transcriptional regulator [uncultured Ruminococcus sp.]
MELSKEIKRLRTEMGWSQEVLAEKAYVSRQTVSNWETEKSYPDIHSLLLLSDVFGVTLDELVKGDVEIMKEVIRNNDAGNVKKCQWTGLGCMMGMIFVVTPLFESGSEVGRIVGCLLAGAMAVGAFMSFRKLEQIKQDNDIQTKRELIAFMNGETLDKIETEREQKNRISNRRMTIKAAMISGFTLLFALGYAVLEIIK